MTEPVVDDVTVLRREVECLEKLVKGLTSRIYELEDEQEADPLEDWLDTAVDLTEQLIDAVKDFLRAKDADGLLPVDDRDLLELRTQMEAVQRVMHRERLL